MSDEKHEALVARLLRYNAKSLARSVFPWTGDRSRALIVGEWLDSVDAYIAKVGVEAATVEVAKAEAELLTAAAPAQTEIPAATWHYRRTKR
jgi:hypothetical protein